MPKQPLPIKRKKKNDVRVSALKSLIIKGQRNAAFI